jgi:hypothetical protein
MANGAVSDRARRRADTEHADHQPEGDGAVQHIGVDGQRHAAVGTIKHVGEQHHDDHCPDQRVMADEREAFAQLVR